MRKAATSPTAPPPAAQSMCWAGNEIMLLGRFSINRQGPFGGGTILVGGNFRGLGTTRRSQYTYVDEHTIILASATDDGDGGQVAVWSDIWTIFAGTIEAKGGPNGG